MPFKPKRPCASQVAVAAEREQYCASIRRPWTNNTTNTGGNPKSNKRYGRSWKRIRDRFIKAHPLCGGDVRSKAS